jgi:hypothetical protein
MTTKLEPILFGLDLDSDPAAFEILFLADDERNNCVAWVPFDRPVKDASEAHRQAQKQIERMSQEDLRSLECTAALLERSGVRVVPRFR